jgi:hypothetical protein
LTGRVTIIAVEEVEVDDGDAAQGVRQLVLIHGRDRASTMVADKHRSLVNIAAEVLADEQQ